MGKSYRKPILKDKPRNTKASTYYRRIRRVTKIAVTQMDEILPEGQEIVNDYDYCDWKWDMTYKDDTDENKIKYSRK